MRTSANASTPLPVLDASRLVRCGTMIILAGMPRAGSTWQQSMVFSALAQLGVPVAHRGYWDFAHHVRANATAAHAYYEREYCAWAHLSDDAVLVYKTHEFAPALAATVCARRIVFTIHRCLDDELGSMRRGFNLTAHGGEHALRVAVAHYDRWVAHGAIDMDYDEARRRPAQASALVGAHLAWRLGRDSRGAVFPAVAEEANPAIPSSSERVVVPAERRFPHPVLRWCGPAS